MDDQKLRRIKRQLLSAADRAYRIGLQVGSGGNFSARVPDTDFVIIKPSGFSFGECTSENLVIVTPDGEALQQGQFPSKEVSTHLWIYKQRKDVMAIFHCHAPWSIACARFFPEIPLIAFHAESKVGFLPVLSIPEDNPKLLTKELEQVFASYPHLKAFIQARHGIFSLSETVPASEHAAELVEETAKIALLTQFGIGSGLRPGQGGRGVDGDA